MSKWNFSQDATMTFIAVLLLTGCAPQQRVSQQKYDALDAEYQQLNQRMSAEVAANPPAAVRHTKRLLRVWRKQAIAAARQREDEAFQERLGTPENVEAIRAFFEKRRTI